MNKNELQKYRDNLELYAAALKALQLKITFVRDSLKRKNPQLNSVKYVTWRVKDEKSLEKKMDRKNVDTIDKIQDIVGARVIFKSKKDIKDFIEEICNSPIIKVSKHKDYFDDKKNSGYRAYHLILEIPLEFNGQIIPMEVELQLRTELQDFWSRIEHAVKYKSDECDPLISLNLKRLSDSIDLCEDLMAECREKTIEAKKPKLKLSKKEEDIYNKNMLYYESAATILDGELKLAIQEFKENNTNGFAFTASRIKTVESVYAKLGRMGYEYNEENIAGHIRDAVGYRIVCTSNSEVLKLVELIKSNTSFRVTRIQDHISTPKDSGYMGYHLNVAIPLKTKDGVKEIIAEIQIRTEAMDAFATYEEEIVYKNENCPEDIKARLRSIGANMAINDFFMDKINQDSIKKKTAKKMGKELVNKEVKNGE